MGGMTYTVTARFPHDVLLDPFRVSTSYVGAKSQPQGNGSRLLESLFKWMYTSVPNPSMEMSRKSPPKYLAYYTHPVRSEKVGTGENPRVEMER